MIWLSWLDVVSDRRRDLDVVDDAVDRRRCKRTARLRGAAQRLLVDCDLRLDLGCVVLLKFEASLSSRAAPRGRRPSPCPRLATAMRP